MVEGTGLENRQRVKPFVSSNPTTSAKYMIKPLFYKGFFIGFFKVAHFVGHPDLKKNKLISMFFRGYLYFHISNHEILIVYSVYIVNDF